MKKTAILTCLCFAGIFSMAQIQRKVAGKPVTDSMAAVTAMGTEGKAPKGKFKDLDLDKQQKIKLKELMQNAKQEKEAIENDEKLSDEQKKQALQELRKRQMAHLDSLLTPEQRQKMVNMKRDVLRQRLAEKKKGVKENGNLETEQ